MQSPIQTYLQSLHRQLEPLNSGELASYIPELTKANPDWFGICIVTMDGTAYCVGDTEQTFTIQSISKAFVFAASLADRGSDYISSKVGVEPSGDAFNSISLHPQTGAPLNPMINAGAIATTSLVGGDSVDAQMRRIEKVITDFVGHPLDIDEEVYRSESATGHRNRAIAWMLKNFGIINGDPMEAVENYFRQCSVLVTCRDLAYMAATLANGGVHPLTKVSALPTENVERVMSVMATCGMYDYAGSWMTEVGMPAKSGVGGGIVAVLPGRFGIGVFSPRLDEKGNSLRGIAACKRISKDLGLNIFSTAHEPGMALGREFTGADAPSRRWPTPEMKERLEGWSHRIKYLCLQGFIAVDGIEFVIRKMLSLVPEAHSFILDMHRVDGISVSAARLLNQTRVGFRDEGISVVFSRIQHRTAISGPLSKAVVSGDRGFLSFEDNDLAVEWCENQILKELASCATKVGVVSEASLFRGLSETQLNQIESACTRRNYAPGEKILTSGEVADGRIFMIETGQVSILVPLEGGRHQRISTNGPGMVFGEMVLLGHTVRSASVHADSAVRCLILDVSELERIAEREPQLKIIVLENVARDLALRLRGATQWIAALA